MPLFDLLYDKVKNIAVGLVQCNENFTAMNNAVTDNEFISHSKAYTENRVKIEALLNTVGLNYNKVAQCLVAGDSDQTALNIVSMYMSTIRYNLKEETA